MLQHPYSCDDLLNPGTPWAGSGQNHVVLVVLDRVEARHQLDPVLKSRGYAVLDTDHGQEASRQARHTKPDLMLVDLDVPLLYGLVAARRIIRQAQLGPLPVVVITHEEVIDPAPMIEVGVTRDEYLTRVSDYAELHHLLEYLLPVLPPAGAKSLRPGTTGDSRREAIHLQLSPVSGPARHPHRDVAPANGSVDQVAV